MNEKPIQGDYNKTVTIQYKRPEIERMARSKNLDFSNQETRKSIEQWVHHWIKRSFPEVMVYHKDWIDEPALYQDRTEYQPKEAVVSIVLIGTTNRDDIERLFVTILEAIDFGFSIMHIRKPERYDYTKDKENRLGTLFNETPPGPDTPVILYMYGSEISIESEWKETYSAKNKTQEGAPMKTEQSVFSPFHERT